jgi:hypothetical protein
MRGIVYARKPEYDECNECVSTHCVLDKGQFEREKDFKAGCTAVKYTTTMERADSMPVAEQLTEGYIED